MPVAETITSAHIHSIVAEHGFEVDDISPNVLAIRQPESGITIQAVLEGEVIFFSLTCLSVANDKLTPNLLESMLSSGNGISTSHFQLYPLERNETAIALTNFAKLQDLGPEDKDDILSCLDFLLADLTVARELLKPLA